MAITQNNRTATNDTLAKALKPAHLRKLARFSRATGYSASFALDRALDVWLEVEAPVYIAHAKKAQAEAV